MKALLLLNRSIITAYVGSRNVDLEILNLSRDITGRFMVLEDDALRSNTETDPPQTVPWVSRRNMTLGTMLL